MFVLICFFSGATALLTVSSATALVLPFGIGRIIDLIYTQSKEGNVLNSLGQLCVILLGIFVVGALANFGRVYLMNVAGSRIINELRKKLFRSVSQQEMAFFDKTRTGELVNRLAADTGIIGQSVTTNISDGLRSLFQAIGGISLMVSGGCAA
jgi:ATP-binding cassette subfamily B (MDR/TAP) protein 10